MASLAPSSSLHADTTHKELYFAIAGFWTRDEMDAFLQDLARTAMPFIRTKTPFVALGNLADFVPQNRETADAIRASLLQASRNGLVKFAVVSPPPLVKLQYRRIAEGLDAQFFDDEPSARRWLRSI
ncbi:MAG: hypothetical protein AAFR64_08540 [Pseudomonadota bacterium]